MIETNVTGLVMLTISCCPTLIARKGAVINIQLGRCNLSLSGRQCVRRQQAFVSQFHWVCARICMAPVCVSPRSSRYDGNRVHARTHGRQPGGVDALYKGANPMTAEDIAEDAVLDRKACRRT
jgi:serine 3-dehydrogenase